MKTALQRTISFERMRRKPTMRTKTFAFKAAFVWASASVFILASAAGVEVEFVAEGKAVELEHNEERVGVTPLRLAVEPGDVLRFDDGDGFAFIFVYQSGGKICIKREGNRWLWNVDEQGWEIVGLDDPSAAEIERGKTANGPSLSRTWFWARLTDLPDEATRAHLGRMPAAGLQLDGADHRGPLDFLRELKNLWVLDVAHQVRPESLAHVEPLVELRALTLRFCPGVENLHSLSHLTSLRYLNLEYFPDLAELQGIAKLPQLTSVRIYEGKKTTALPAFKSAGLRRLIMEKSRDLTDIGALAALRRLERLKLDDCPAVKDFSALGALARLRKLSLSRAVGLTALTVLRGFDGLEELNLNGCRELSDFSALQTLSGLTSLNVNGCGKLSDLGVLSGLSSLCELSLWGCAGVSDIAPLAKLDKLEEVILNGCKNVKDVSPLAELKNLSGVGLPVNVSAASFAELCRSGPRLKKLVLSYCQTKLELGGLSEVKMIERMTFVSNKTVTHLNDFQNLSGLTNGNFAYCVNLGDIAALAAAQNLRVLDLKECFPLQDLSPIAGLKNLTSLSLRHVNEVKKLAPLKELTALRTLELLGCEGERDLSPLYGMIRLQTVSLPKQTDDAALAELCRRLPQLENLSLGYCKRVTDLSPTTDLKRLRRLYLRECDGVADLSPVATLTRLEQLNAAKCEKLRDLTPLAGLRGLKTLVLSDCVGLKDLSPLSGLVSLTRLNLDGCASVEDLAPLHKAVSLSVVDLRGCAALKPEAVAALRVALPDCTILR
jgi:Leucine-rich repeat (LRR) protein